LNFEAGFSELRRGSGVCLVSTGHMTHKALRVADTLAIHGLRAGVIDVFVLKPVCEPMLAEALGGYAHIVTLDESFLRKGSLDTMVSDILRDNGSPAKLTRFGFTDKYVFEVGNREHLHALNGLDDDTIVSTIVRANDNPRSKP
jgi:transketolase